MSKMVDIIGIGVSADGDVRILDNAEELLKKHLNSKSNKKEEHKYVKVARSKKYKWKDLIKDVKDFKEANGFNDRSENDLIPEMSELLSKIYVSSVKTKSFEDWLKLERYFCLLMLIWYTDDAFKVFSGDLCVFEETNSIRESAKFFKDLYSNFDTEKSRLKLMAKLHHILSPEKIPAVETMRQLFDEYKSNNKQTSDVASDIE